MKRASILLALILCTASCSYATVPTDASRISSLYACDGSDTTFTFSFGITDDDDLEVILVTDATGAETVLITGQHYTVASANANDPQSWNLGGTVTTVATYSADYSIWLRSNVERTQATNIDDEDVEAVVDKLTYIAADIYEVLSRCLKIQPTESGDTVQFTYDGTAGYVYRNAAGDFSTVASVDAGDLTVGSFWEDTLTGSTLATAQSDLMIPQGLYVVTAHPYHAAGDGSTNDANAIQTAIDTAEAATKPGGIVQIPPGTYHLDDSLVWNATYAYGGATNAKMLVKGASQYGSVLTRDSADANGFAVTVTGATGWEQGFWGFRDLMFDGGSGRDTSGISVNVSGRSGMAVDNCAFWRTDIAYKNVGAIDWKLHGCTFNRGNIGLWLQPLSTMHGGCGLVDGGFNISYMAQAAVYIQGKAGTTCMEQLKFENGVIEANTGFAIFVNYWRDTWPLIFDHIYFETNGTADTATLDGTTYHDPQMLYLHDATNVHFISCKLTNGTEDQAGGDIIDSTVYTYNCYLLPAYGDFNMVGNSRMYHSHPYVAGNYVFDGNEICVDSMLPARQFAGSTVYRTMMRHRIRPWNYDYAQTNLLSTGSCAVDFTPADANSETYSFVRGDAPGFGTYLSVRLPTATDYDDGVQVWANFARDANYIYVFSIDVKTDTNDAELTISSVGGDGNLLLYQSTTAGTGCHGIMAVPWEWRRYYGFATDVYSTDVQDMYLWNKGATAETFHIANVQLVKFDNYNEAIQWIEESKYPWPSGLSIPMPPPTDTWLAVRTVCKSIDLDDDASTDDYQYDDDAANTTEQVVTLTNILPAYAELVSWQVRCFESTTGATTFTVDFGTTSGGQELGTAVVDDTGEVLAAAAGAAPTLAATSSARSLYVGGNPSANWSTMASLGRWCVFVTYIDYAAVYTQKAP